MWIMIVCIIPQDLDRSLFSEIFVKFTYLIEMIADQTFMTYVLHFFIPTALAMTYGRRPKFFRAEHLATAEGENCSYGPTLRN
jgi:hypothetical protein